MSVTGMSIAEGVGLDGVLDHLAALERIAARNGGRRTSGTPGHEESVDHLADTLRAAGFAVWTEEFVFPYCETVQERLVLDGEPFDVTVMRHSPDTPVGGSTARLAVLPAEVARGCAASDYAGGDYAGTIVLVERGGCAFARKQQLAADAGAIGVLVHNNNDEWPLGSLGSPAAARVPTAGVARAVGEALRGRAGAEVTLTLRTWVDPRPTRNLFAQTTTGRTDRLVLAGAHLDSVVEGPGINDAGTGCAALVETALRMGAAPGLPNAVRFAFWGAEEFGQLGSRHHVDRLTARQLADIGCYLTFDMLGSPNGGYFVFDGTGNAGCGQIEAALVDFFAARGVATEPEPIRGGFDHMAFLDAGIAVGGLYTGASGIKTAAQAAKWGGVAGAAYDSNYHRPTDVLAAVNRTALRHNVAATAWLILACASDEISPQQGEAGSR